MTLAQIPENGFFVQNSRIGVKLILNFEIFLEQRIGILSVFSTYGMSENKPHCLIFTD